MGNDFFRQFQKWNSVTILHCVSLLLWEWSWTVHRGIHCARRILTDYRHINPMYNDGTDVCKSIRWRCRLNNLPFLLKEKSEAFQCFPRRHWIMQTVLRFILEGFYFYKTMTASHGKDYWTLSPAVRTAPHTTHVANALNTLVTAPYTKILPPCTCMIILCIYVFHYKRELLRNKYLYIFPLS